MFEEPDEVDPLLLQDEVSCADVAMEGQVAHNTFKCKYCEFRAIQEKSLRSHVNRVHARNLGYACGVCNFQCRWNKEYYDHMKTHYQVFLSYLLLGSSGFELIFCSFYHSKPTILFFFF